MAIVLCGQKHTLQLGSLVLNAHSQMLQGDIVELCTHNMNMGDKLIRYITVNVEKKKNNVRASHSVFDLMVFLGPGKIQLLQ